MIMQIPNLKKILEPRWLHKVGWGVDSRGWHKREKLTQATVPKDNLILQKIGVQKGDKVLAIAGFYADWATSLVRTGAKVDYSDISKGLVNYVKKKRGKMFGKYICSNYELIPKKPKEYDWTFTFEACGARQGLPIAYLRSLLNNKGGILVIYTKPGKHMGGKAEKYPKIVKNLAKTYKTQYKIKDIKVRTQEKGFYQGFLPHRIYTIKTNNSARQKVELDLRVLNHIHKKRIIYLEKGLKSLDLEKKEFKDSIIRLSKLSKILGEPYKKEVEVR